jgi:hypothetical protein
MKACCPCTCDPASCLPEEGFSVEKFPLEEATMYVKTVKMNKNVIENFNTLKVNLDKKSGAGYCEKTVNHMLAVSNQRICKSK